MKTVHPPELGPYKCPMFQICGKTLESGVKVHKHMYSHASKPSKILNDTKETKLNRNKTNRHDDPLVNDVKVQNSKFTCNFSVDHINATCSEAFNTATKFIQHMRQVHKTKPWICLQCPGFKRFPRP